jgi:hypothetical protein
MSKVLATLDNSLADTPVLSTANALAPILGADVEAVHVRTNGARTAERTAKAAGVPLRTLTGDVVERIVAAGEAPEVVALAIGARGRPSGRPLGATAVSVATALLKPVVVVPPDAQVSSIGRVLVPLEGTVSSSLAPRAVVELARAANVEVVALHVLDENSIPAFTDQPQHESSAWTREFLARYCPWGVDIVRLETRVGRAAALVPAVADECGCDLVVLGWSHELSATRAPVVRATLERSLVPVMLLPVLVAAPSSSGAARGRSGVMKTRRQR